MSIRISSVLTGLFGLALIISFSIFISLLLFSLRGEALKTLNSRFNSVLDLNQSIVSNLMDRNQSLTRALSENFMIIKAFDDLKGGLESSRLDIVEKIYKSKTTDRHTILVGNGEELYEFMHEAHHKQIRKYLRTSFYSDLMLIQADGRVLYTFRKEDEFLKKLGEDREKGAKLSVLKKLTHDAAERKEVVTGLYWGEKENPNMISVMPIHISGKMAGFVATVLPLKYLKSKLNDAGLMGKTGEIILTDVRVNALVAVGGVYSGKAGYEMSEKLKLISGRKFSKPQLVHMDGQRVHAIARKFLSQERQYYILLTQLHEEIFKSSVTLQYKLTLVGVFILIAALALIVFISRQVSFPLAKVTSELTRVTSGDFENVVKIRSGLIEIQRISKALSKFRESVLERQQLEKSLIERSVEMEFLNEEMKDKNAELEEYRDHLEEKVQERTKIIEEQAAQLEASLEKQKELNHLQRSFVSMASHEFRTPLAIIDAVSQKIIRRVDKMPKEKLLEQAEKIRTAVRRMTGLMESTLAAAKTENGKIQVKIGDCDIRKILTDCCRVQQELARNHKILLNLDEAPDVIRADPAALEQVFTNLLSNAVKYSPDAPQIDVIVRRDESMLLIDVADHGLGIDEEELPKMFTRFFRAKTSTGIAGTGIGLNLCKMLMEEHGGDITLSSVKGEGSTFTVALPLSA